MNKNSLIYALHRSGVYGLLDRGRDYRELSKVASRRSFSQFGEDLFLRDYFGDRKGLYIEVGGNHPFSLSNTYLLYRMGWRGLVIEPIHRLYAKHRRFRPRDIQVNAAVGDGDGDLRFYEMIPSVLSTCDPQEAANMIAAGSAKLFREYSVPMMSVADLYHTHLAPHPISLLSVDTEGHDMAVLRGVDWELIQPEIVICEANDDIRRLEISQFLTSHCYENIKSLGCNMLFRHSQG
ncbi:FkbM family methyltransferase [Alloacidobacterium dinghuense]|uniref:FkbM family methyltransferase n=1 Tax=Alloacidobacterium dinghuense TaxID=2763107 RepID=A0A7G8BE03_9BACT|nr:FkbM family methyltransferase [Alloacidobacterium dinghuense]QNI30773.1 FkbM family methyltransferase [Alloacidobacterium dinghuense]